MAGRRISGSPRSHRRPRGRGTRHWLDRAGRMRHVDARHRRAPTRRRRGRARRRAASGRCAIPGTARRRILYSAWIEKLFDAPLDADLSWPALHEVLRDRSRNILFNYLGLGEDEVAMSLRPDCADFVYFLRAYFAFKMGLPFGYSKCSRGGGGKPPKCYATGSDRMQPIGAASAARRLGGCLVRRLFAGRRRRRSVRRRADVRRTTTTPIFTPCR